MKFYLKYVLLLTLHFYVRTFSNLPPVPNTQVIKPPPLDPKQPHLTIYYDAMEGNSQAFFNTTLVKDFGIFASYINLNLIPCQQAKDNGANITCESKVDSLCNLDIIHSCAIDQVTNQTQLVHFLGCTMSTVQKPIDFEPCAHANGIDVKQIQTCASSDKGKNLCKKYSTRKIPPTSKMPGFIFKNANDIKNDDPFEHMDNYMNDVGATDLQSALCGQLKANNAINIPQDCNKKLVFGIFYKAYAEFSRKWFKAFEPAYQKLSKCLTIKYEPCMFAEMSQDGKLQCNDIDDRDCEAARTHSCAISMVKDTDKLSQFIICTMRDMSLTKLADFKTCASNAGIQYDIIKKCADSDMGTSLCFDNSKTRPKIEKIPAFSYEFTFDENISRETLSSKDLVTTICQQMKQFKITCPDCGPC